MNERYSSIYRLGGIVMGEHQANPQDIKKFFVWTKKGKGVRKRKVREVE